MNKADNAPLTAGVATDHGRTFAPAPNSMIVVTIWKGSDKLETRTCNKGELLPTIATLMQKHEGGAWEHQRGYAVSWRVVKE